MNTWYELAKARMKARKITQEILAEHLGVTQGAVAHWMGGRREPSLEVIKKILHYLELPPIMSPAVHMDTEHPGQSSAWVTGDPLTEHDCEVPFFDQIEITGSNGMTEVVEIDDRQYRLSRATLEAAGVTCANAACARVHGRSMERLIPEETAIGFDRSDCSIIDGEIYAFDQGGLLRVKYLYRLPAGAVRARSENSQDYPDEIISAEHYRREVKMLGRVFWWATVRRSPKRN
jgi:phage repressor protein C with HTH and peptisase S24 domain